MITVEAIDHGNNNNNNNNNSKSTYSSTFELGRDNGKPVLLLDSDNSGGLVIYNKVS